MKLLTSVLESLYGNYYSTFEPPVGYDSSNFFAAKMGHVEIVVKTDKNE